MEKARSCQRGDAARKYCGCVQARWQALPDLLAAACLHLARSCKRLMVGPKTCGALCHAVNAD